MLEDGTLLTGGGNEIKAWDSLSAYKSVKERTVGITENAPKLYNKLILIYH